MEVEGVSMTVKVEIDKESFQDENEIIFPEETRNNPDFFSSDCNDPLLGASGVFDQETSLIVPSDLKHKRIHASEKPKISKLPLKTYAHIRNIYRHKKTHQSLGPYHCDVCWKDFPHLDLLKQHYEEHKTGYKEQRKKEEDMEHRKMHSTAKETPKVVNYILQNFLGSLEVCPKTKKTLQQNSIKKTSVQQQKKHVPGKVENTPKLVNYILQNFARGSKCSSDVTGEKSLMRKRIGKIAMKEDSRVAAHISKDKKPRLRIVRVTRKEKSSVATDATNNKSPRTEPNERVTIKKESHIVAQTMNGNSPGKEPNQRIVIKKESHAEAHTNDEYPRAEENGRINVKEEICINPEIEDCLDIKEESIDYDIYGMLDNTDQSQTFFSEGKDSSNIVIDSDPLLIVARDESRESEDTNLKKLFSCKGCGKMFSNKGNLIIHQRSHTEEPYSCDKCEKKFFQRCHLMSHQRAHSEKESLTSKVCSRTFANKQNFVEHNRMHKKEKYYDCKICMKKFSRIRQLMIHGRIHMKEKPYS